MLKLSKKDRGIVLMEYKLNDLVTTKKPHPRASRSNKWQIIRVGADIKIKCIITTLSKNLL